MLRLHSLLIVVVSYEYNYNHRLYCSLYDANGFRVDEESDAAILPASQPPRLNKISVGILGEGMSPIIVHPHMQTCGRPCRYIEKKVGSKRARPSLAAAAAAAPSGQ